MKRDESGLAKNGKKVGRRVAVSAEATEEASLSMRRSSRTSLDKITQAKKTAKVRELITKSIQTNLLFEGVETEALSAFVDSMDCQETQPGDQIIAEGDVGDFFYVVEYGEYQVFLKQAGEEPILTYVVTEESPAPNFGDLALLYSCPRKATVKCSVEGRLWRLAAFTYASILREAAVEAKKERMKFLRSVSILKPLEEAQLDQLATSMEPVKYSDGEVVVQQGDPADALYFIEKGSVEVFIAKEGDLPVAKMKAGQFFGENAVSSDDESPTRAATVKTKGDVEMLKLSSENFTDLIGNLSQRIAANFSEKVLGGMSMLKTLDNSQRQRLVNALEEKHFSKGTEIITKGEEGDTFYILISGTVTVTSGKEVIKESMGAGEYFGERAILTSESRGATVSVTSETAVCMQLNREQFNSILGPLKDLISKQADIREQEANEVKSKAPIDFADLEIRNILGVGTFGRVKLVRHVPTDTPYALKCLRKGQVIALKQAEHVMNEKNILAMCKHPFLLDLVATWQDKEELYMLMQLALGGELFTALRDRVRFDEPTGRFYAACVASAFEYLHDRKIVYRDLKPENLLLDSDGYIKVVDFGFAKVLDMGRTWTLCGTPEYLAPEIISNKGHNVAVDWWALGILIFELLDGSPPFAADDPMHIYQKILRGKVSYPITLSPKAKEICTKLLLQNPAARLGQPKRGVREIRTQPFFAPMDFGALEAKKLKAPIKPVIHDPLDTSNFDFYEEEDGSEWARFNENTDAIFAKF